MTLAGRPRSAPPAGAPRGQSRARYPDARGHVERDGVRVAYEVYGEDGPAALLLPAWSIVHSRLWKAQIPYLARHCRVVTFDGRGNGGSDRPEGAAAYAVGEFAADALAVLDAAGVDRATVVCLSAGALWGSRLAAEHPERVEGIVYIAPAVPLGGAHAARESHPFEPALDTTEGWAKFNRHYWSAHYREFLEFFFAQAFPEGHCTKQVEDCVGWGLETTPETLADTYRGTQLPPPEPFTATLARVHCPAVVIHGDDDRIRPHAQGAALAAATGGTLITLEGAGHIPVARDPVKVNLLLRDLIAPPAAAARRRRGPRRGRRRALFISSPIGLGHARRDLAIADELRALHPDLEIDWLAQHPVTAMLATRGERIHPASAYLANESAHIESESAEHDLHCFQAIRRMDEILVANFMVFTDVVRDDPYDLWIGDEAWELDHFLHENPELKTAAYAWLTDFVGWLPSGRGRPRARAHRGLQRGDDRADRPLPARARPRHLRRRPRGRRAGALRPGPARDPRLDGRALRLRGLRHRLRPGGVRRPRAAAPRAGLRRRTSRSASSRSAARAWRHLLRRVIAASPRPRRSSPACA